MGVRSETKRSDPLLVQAPVLLRALPTSTSRCLVALFGAMSSALRARGALMKGQHTKARRPPECASFTYRRAPVARHDIDHAPTTSFAQGTCEMVRGGVRRARAHRARSVELPPRQLP